jgi:hypothetical protein
MLPRLSPAQQVARVERARAVEPAYGRMIAMGIALVALVVGSIVGARIVDGPTTGDGEALPAYASALSHTTRAKLRLHEGVDAARGYFLNHGTFESLRPRDLERRQPALSWVSAYDDARVGEISVDANGDTQIVLASEVADGLCAFARDIPIQARTEVVLRPGHRCRASQPPDTGWVPEDSVSSATEAAPTI